MIELVFLVFGAFMLTVGLWQVRHPEKTQDLILRHCRGRLWRRFYPSDHYYGAVYLNGLVLTIIGAAVVLFVVASLVMGVVWPGPK